VRFLLANIFLQQKSKVGTGDPSRIPEVEQLIRFYKEKCFGV
jgi:hypothetical protein